MPTTVNITSVVFALLALILLVSLIIVAAYTTINWSQKLKHLTPADRLKSSILVIGVWVIVLVFSVVVYNNFKRPTVGQEPINETGTVNPRLIQTESGAVDLPAIIKPPELSGSKIVAARIAEAAIQNEMARSNHLKRATQ